MVLKKNKNININENLNSIEKFNILKNDSVYKQIVNDDKPIVNDDKPIVNDDKPIENDDKQIVNDDKPIVNYDKPIENDDKPIENNNKLIKNDDKLIKNDDNEYKIIDLKSNDFLKELLINQLKNINPNKKLNYGDIKRISKFLTNSIFHDTTCSLWNGYVTNEKNQTKGTYINFYFNKKKIALHRLLYINYIGEISNKEYIRFTCDNKGKCCNINHMKKYSYNRNFSKINNLNNNNPNNINISYKNDLTIEF